MICCALVAFALGALAAWRRAWRRWAVLGLAGGCLLAAGAAVAAVRDAEIMAQIRAQPICGLFLRN